MGKFKEEAIMAQDAIISEEYATMYESAPQTEPTEGDLRGMQVKECLLLVDLLETQLDGMIFRNRYYDAPLKTEDIEDIIVTLKELRRTLQ